MTRKEVLTRLCQLSQEVMVHLECQPAADCFCGSNPVAGVLDDYRFDAPVIEFIEEAVKEKIARTA